jgi:hypothetical protein
MTQSCGD